MGTESAHLLVVHSNAETRGSLSKLLETANYNVSTTGDDGQALDMLQAQNFDAVLCGGEFAGLDGYRMLERLNVEAHHGRTGVIVIAAANEPAIISRCLALGADDFLVEPVQPAQLKAKVQAILEKKQLRERVASLKVRLQKLTHDLTEVILPVGIALSAEKNLDRLLERILREGKAICNADGGTIYLRTKEDTLKFVIMHNDSLGITLGGTTGREILHTPLDLYDRVSGEPNHHNVATHVALQGETINIPDVYYAEGFNFFATKHFDELNNYRTISCLTIPLKDNANEVVGVLQLLNAQDPKTKQVIPFDFYLRLVAESLASQAAVALNNHLLLQRERELMKFERDVQIGRQMQADFLPAELPALTNWEIAASFQPAREVSGDFYDAFTLMDNTRVALVIADVCDKGVGAALFMTLIRSLIRAFSEQHYSLFTHDSLTNEQSAAALRNAVSATNNYIATNHARMFMFATLFFGVLDPVSGSLIYVNGGHEAPVLVGPNGIRARLGQTGPAVGMMPGVNFKVEETELSAGDMLVAYTDGVTEARSPEKEFFSEHRLLPLLESQRTIDAGAMLKLIEANLRSYIASAEQFDDITMLAIRRI